MGYSSDGYIEEKKLSRVAQLSRDYGDCLGALSSAKDSAYFRPELRYERICSLVRELKAIDAAYESTDLDLTAQDFSRLKILRSAILELTQELPTLKEQIARLEK